MKIESVKARQILDSRGNPTLECDVILDGGIVGRASVPSGASTGENEAKEIRDEDQKHFGGQGELVAVDNVEKIICPAIVGIEPTEQAAIDQKMMQLDGTENFSKLGAESVLVVSIAAAKAAALSLSKPLYWHFAELIGNVEFVLPMPMFNVVNGGRHANFATEIQEFMIVPVGAKNFSEALEMGTEVYHHLGEILGTLGNFGAVGDEGGFVVANVGGNKKILDLISQATEKAGFKFGEEIVLALDFASSEFFHDGKYEIKSEGKSLSQDEYLSWITELVSGYPIKSIEDPFAQTDFDGWKKIMNALSGKLRIVGDDLTVTNSKYLQKAIDEKLCSGVIIKPNQVGTVTGTLETIKLAKTSNITAIVSHRSGETEDTTIAHLAVGTGTKLIKAGSTARGERLAKYNELLRIEEELAGSAKFSSDALN